MKKLLGVVSLLLAAVWLSPSVHSQNVGLGAPQGVGAKYYGNIVHWSPPAAVQGETLAYYNVYRGEGPTCSNLEFVQEVKDRNVTSVIWYDFSAFDAGETYWYAETAVDTNGVEGPMSACESAVIPADTE
jgi:hypothetical protein